MTYNVFGGTLNLAQLQNYTAPIHTNTPFDRHVLDESQTALNNYNRSITIMSVNYGLHGSSLGY